MPGNVLRRAGQQHAVTAPGHPLDTAALVALMARAYWTELGRRVEAADAAHLAAIYRGRQAPEAEFRVTEAAARTGRTQAAASKIVQRLAVAGAIEPARTEGKSAYYRLRGGDVTVALRL